jgi:hypothetical protein
MEKVQEIMNEYNDCVVLVKKNGEKSDNIAIGLKGTPAEIGYLIKRAIMQQPDMLNILTSVLLVETEQDVKLRSKLIKILREQE